MTLLRDLAKPAPIVDVGQHDLELVTSEPPDLATPSDDSLDALRNLLEQFVTRRVPKRVIDRLEAIEVEHEQCATPLGGLVGSQRGGEPLRHAMSVGKTS